MPHFLLSLSHEYFPFRHISKVLISTPPNPTLGRLHAAFQTTPAGSERPSAAALYFMDEKWAHVRWRVQGIPPGVDKEALRQALSKHDDLRSGCDSDQSSDNVTILTLASDIRAINPKQTATVQFAFASAKLKSLPPRNRLTIKLETSSSTTTTTRITIDRNFLGLTILHSPSTDVPAEKQVNILAVSGLGSHALGSFINKNDKDNIWLDGLSEDMSFARIMIYGYDSTVRGSISFASVGDFANTLYVPMREILLMHQSTVPLIVVAHSLGGLLVKELFIRMAASPEDSDLLQLVLGVLFFGVPHNGMEIASLVAVVGDQPNRPLLESIGRTNSTMLMTQRRQFSEVLEKTSLDVFCFYETEFSPTAKLAPDGTFTMTGSPCRLVDIQSATACFRSEESRVFRRIAIAKNHSDLVKFELGDQDYENVRAVTEKLYSNPPTAQISQGGVSQALTQEKQQWLTKELLQELFKSLAFDEMDDRRMNVSEGHEGTCEWLLMTPEYRQWLDPDSMKTHNGFLWVKGNAGAGKSTLMKFAVEHIAPDVQTISFFFNARGQDLEKSTLGMYRALIWQLLQPLDLLTCQMILEDATKIKSTGKSPLKWTLPSLQRVFRNTIKRLQGVSIACYIDALDECDIDEIWEMVSFIESIGPTARNSSDVHLRFCFASRHYPEITMEKVVTLNLDRQIQHQKAIARYVNARLRIGTGLTANNVRLQLQQKAAGVFMWAVLVTAILNKTFARGRDHELLEKLNEVPGDLHGLFKDILHRDQHGREELRLCLVLVLWSKRPLTPSELFHAIQIGRSAKPLSIDPSHGGLDFARHNRFILDCSKGLVEAIKPGQQRNRNSKVQFIHESVLDFLVKSRGFEEIWPHPETGRVPDIQGSGHQTIARCCLDYIQYCTHRLASSARTGALQSVTSSASGLDDTLNTRAYRYACTSSFLFMKYAVDFALDHAETACEAGLDLTGFLGSFQGQLMEWIILNNIRHHELLHVPRGATLMCYLAQRNLHNLIRSCPGEHTYFEAEEIAGVPILAALCSDQSDAVKAMLRLETCNESSPLQHLHEEYCPSSHITGPSFARSSRRGTRVAVLRKLLSMQEYIVALHLSEALTPEFIETKDTVGRSMLSVVAKSGYHRATEYMLSHGASVKSVDEEGRSALTWAAIEGRDATVKLLLDADADIELADLKSSQTPLLYAVKNGRVSTIQVLVSRGANIEAKDDSGCTPLFLAVARDDVAAVDFLLSRGASVTAADNDGETPLSLAAYKRDDSMIRLLVGGADSAVKKNSFVWIPLLQTTGKRNEDKMSLCIHNSENTISLTLDTARGQKMVHLSTQTTRHKVVGYLRRIELEVIPKNEQGQPPLAVAALLDALDIVDLLLMKGARLDATSGEFSARALVQRVGPDIAFLLAKSAELQHPASTGWEPLIKAIREGTDFHARFLLRNGADFALRDVDGRNALAAAAFHDREDIVNALLERGASVDNTDNEGRTALILALASEHRRVRPINRTVQILLTHGADVNHRDKRGWKAMDWLDDGVYGDAALVAALRKKGGTRSDYETETETDGNDRDENRLDGGRRSKPETLPKSSFSGRLPDERESEVEEKAEPALTIGARDPGRNDLLQDTC